MAVVLVLLGIFVYYLFRGSGSATTRNWGSPRTSVGSRSDSAEVNRLHDELKRMVLGDEKRVKRLVDYERRPGSSKADCYRAAIDRLVNDRS